MKRDEKDVKWVEETDGTKRVLLEIAPDGSALVLCLGDIQYNSYMAYGVYDIALLYKYQWCEIKEPTYKPYTELTEEVKDKLRGKYIIAKDGSCELLVTGFVIDSKHHDLGVRIDGVTHTLDYLYENFKHQDNTQIGELTE